ncbi:PREDICTED: 1-acyl-sn-glycerol-3-phosphate acyltransferase alpha [Nicrophorus vespilloides]|uniref:1-acyl-sn-glycerol-3-phosphate acyltransferase n=1 Tax=Nicrophorus vespilloides TaxID=110193 RepID=A0ABM1N4R7_NICVS|nr:PREDICTED: 1-acyl-sn-glycerol-3-phosphate acyltransferase alpha [Nicrophorus vespilloides]
MNPMYVELLMAICCLALPFLYESSQSFRFYVKFISYYVVVSFFAVLFIPIFAFRPKNVRNLVISSYICKNVSPLLGLKWILRGKEHLEKERACVIVANHQSSLDVLGMYDMWPIMDKCTVVAKKELFYIWPFGLASWLCGLIFIDRMNSNKAKEAMNEAGELIKRKKIKLWVFPEGTRHNTGEIHGFKKGAFHLAIAAQLPILPVVYSRYYFLDEKNKRFDTGKVIITTLAPISTEGMTTEDLEKLMDMTHKAMSETYLETSKEVCSMCNLEDADGIKEKTKTMN